MSSLGFVMKSSGYFREIPEDLSNEVPFEEEESK